ncbi:MAG: 2-dehydropantoate 2-reductase [Hyphomicrobium sp.]|nr:2-dehydropantoate 2-reductase [Hyphomicrobium sp.]
MRISILGAGAIGCYFAARLAASGAEVQVIARGETLEAIRRNGVRIEGNADVAARPMAFAIEDARPADLLVTCVKAYALPQLAPSVARLVKPEGLWLSAVNGLPWWYGDRPLAAVDPGGQIRASFSMERAASCVAYLAAEVLRPGVIAFVGGKGLILGTPTDRPSALLDEAAAAFTAAGIASSVSDDIRSALWNKLFGNVGLNPLTAMTGLSVDKFLADIELKTMLIEITGEAMRVAEAGRRPTREHGDRTCRGNVSPRRVPTSMLQDADAGRAIELDAILGALLEVADRRCIAVPTSRRAYALVRGFALSRGLLPG